MTSRRFRTSLHGEVMDGGHSPGPRVHDLPLKGLERNIEVKRADGSGRIDGQPTDNWDYVAALPCLASTGFVGRLPCLVRYRVAEVPPWLQRGVRGSDDARAYCP